MEIVFYKYLYLDNYIKIENYNTIRICQFSLFFKFTLSV